MAIIPFFLVKKFYKLKYLVYKFILKPSKAVKSAYGVYLTPSFKDKTFMYYYKGTYGFFLSNLIKNISCDTTFIDIGANQGLYTVLAGKNNYIKKIIAFEPSQKTAQLLRSNIEINDVQNCVVIQKGISSKTGSLELNISDGHSGKNNFRTVDNDTNHSNEIVATINHKEIETLINEETNYIVKIDVEGHEEVVINELIKCTFIKNVSAIFCEIDTQWVNVKNIKEKLASVGFSTFKKIGNGTVHYDILITRN